MNYIIIDIETKPDTKLIDMFLSNIEAPKNLKDPVKIEEALNKKKAEAKKCMSVDPDYADIICIGVKEEGKEPSLLSLKEFAGLINDIDRSTKIVTFNGKKFDIPCIMKQGIKQSVELPYFWLNNIRNKYSERHVDLMELLGEYGSFKSLDTYLHIYLGISKKPIDFNTASEQEIKEHCIEDLINTEKLYNKFKILL